MVSYRGHDAPMSAAQRKPDMIRQKADFEGVGSARIQTETLPEKRHETEAHYKPVDDLSGRQGSANHRWAPVGAGDGRIMASARGGEATLVVDIDIGLFADCRRNYPYLKDFRRDFYRAGLFGTAS